MPSTKVGVCRNCGKLRTLPAKQLCKYCYSLVGSPVVMCKGCKVLKHHHGKGYCVPCFKRYVNPDYYRLHSRYQYTGITKEVFAKLDKKCLICGFDKLIDVHHLVAKSKGGSHAPSNLIVLCPNHHKMTHHADYREDMLKQIKEKRGSNSPERVITT